MMRQKYTKKKNIDPNADPVIQLNKINTFLNSLKEYNESNSKSKLQQADQIAAIIMSETAQTVRDLGTPINIDPEDIESRFEYIDELQEIIDNLLKENEKIKLDMAVLALSIHEAIHEAKNSFKLLREKKPKTKKKSNNNVNQKLNKDQQAPQPQPEPQSEYKKVKLRQNNNENDYNEQYQNKNNLGNLANLFGKVGV